MNDPRDEAQSGLDNLTRTIRARSQPNLQGESQKLRSTKTVKATVLAIVTVVVDRVLARYGLDMGEDVRACVYTLVAGLIVAALRHTGMKIERGLGLAVLILALAGCCSQGKVIEAVGKQLNGATGDVIHKALDNDESLTEDRRQDVKINLWLLAESIEKAGGPKNTRKQP